MIGLFSKHHPGILVALLVATTLPVMAGDSAIDSVGKCPDAAALNALRPALKPRLPSSLVEISGTEQAECATFVVLSEYRAISRQPWLEGEPGQSAGWSTAFEIGEEGQVAGHSTPTKGGRLSRLWHHVSWSWDPPPSYAIPFQMNAMPERL